MADQEEAARDDDDVSLADVGPLLQSFRRRQGRRLSSPEADANSGVATSTEDSASAPDEVAHTSVVREVLKVVKNGELAAFGWWDRPATVTYNQVLDRLRDVEEGRIKTTHPLRDIYPLAIKGYGISALMLDHLLSKSVKGALVGRLDVGSMKKTSANIPHLEDKCEYHVPLYRLEDSTTAFVRLDISPGGHSDIHSHPGDEMIVLLDGEMDIYLESSGTLTRLRNKGDYIHFNAEHEHSAWSVPQMTAGATAFVIRFYQLPDGGTRKLIQDTLKKVCQELRASNPSGLKHSTRNQWNQRVGGWLLQAFRNPVSQETLVSPTVVLDPVGLSRFLRQFMEMKGLGDAEVRELLQQHGPWTEDKVTHLLDGQPVNRVSINELDALATALSVPRILLYSFLFPTFPNMVVVADSRNGLMTVASEPEVERPPMTDEDTPEPETESTREDNQKKQGVGLEHLYRLPNREDDYAAQYFIPRRRLAGSDIQVTFIRLPAGGTTPPNEHPGSELVVPLEGQVRVEFPGQKDQILRLNADAPEYAHYDSSAQHLVINDSDESPATVFVVRFQSTEEVNPRDA